jgi:hypothetical protein
MHDIKHLHNEHLYIEDPSQPHRLLGGPLATAADTPCCSERSHRGRRVYIRIPTTTHVDLRADRHFPNKLIIEPMLLARDVAARPGGRISTSLRFGDVPVLRIAAVLRAPSLEIMLLLVHDHLVEYVWR